MTRRQELEKMTGVQLMDLIEKYELEPGKRQDVIDRILAHEGHTLTKNDLKKMTGAELIDTADKLGVRVAHSGGKLKETKQAAIDRIGAALPKKKRGARNAAKTKLKAARVAAGVTQSALADAADLNVRTLQHYEQGYKPFDNARLDTILKVCLALDCDLSDVLDNEDYIALWNDYCSR